MILFLGFVATPLCQLNLSQFNHLLYKNLKLYQYLLMAIITSFLDLFSPRKHTFQFSYTEHTF